ncbi:MAG: lysophospholipid acyltransferase family protein [Acidimicrobiia bacterium]
MVRIPLGALRAVVAVTVQTLATFIIGSYLIVLLKVRPKTRQVPRVMRIWARLFLLVTGTRVTVEGAERIDPAGSYVFVGNHSSNLDIPVIMGKLPVSIRFLAKKEMFKVPVLGGAMRAIHMVETDRRLGPTAHRAINEQVTAVVTEGLSLMIFPEGTRSESHEMLPFKKGAFRIAVDNDMPVVPVTIVGTLEAWKPHSKLIHGGRVRLVIHDPIPTTDLDRNLLNDLRDRVRSTVAEALNR